MSTNNHSNAGANAGVTAGRDRRKNRAIMEIQKPTRDEVIKFFRRRKWMGDPCYPEGWEIMLGLVQPKPEVKSTEKEGGAK